MSILDRVRSVLDGATPFWKESLVYLGGNLVNAALPVALMPILTRYLSPTDYGIVGTSAALVQFLSVAMSLNSSGLIVTSQFEEKRENQRKLVSTNLLLAFAFATLLGLWALGAGHLVERATEFPAAWSPAVVLLALTGVIQATYLCLLQARKETTRYVSLQVLSTGLNLGLFFDSSCGAGNELAGSHTGDAGGGDGDRGDLPPWACFKTQGVGPDIWERFAKNSAHVRDALDSPSPWRMGYDDGAAPFPEPAGYRRRYRPVQRCLQSGIADSDDRGCCQPGVHAGLDG